MSSYPYAFLNHIKTLCWTPTCKFAQQKRLLHYILCGSGKWSRFVNFSILNWYYLCMDIPSLALLHYKTEGIVKCWFAIFPTENPECRPQCLMSLDKKKQRHYNDQQNAERTRCTVISQTPTSEHPFFAHIHNTSQRAHWQHPATHNCAVEKCIGCFWLLWVFSEDRTGRSAFPESWQLYRCQGKTLLQRDH